jgi:Co/Zn/Cd efflux system component
VPTTVGSFFNGVFLIALALSIFLQSIERFISVEPIKDPLSVIIVGAVGLCINLLSAFIVHGQIISMSPLRFISIDVYVSEHGHHGTSDNVVPVASTSNLELNNFGMRRSQDVANDRMPVAIEEGNIVRL